MTLVEFIQLLRAPTVTVDIFGLEFPLRPEQQKALWKFAEGTLPARSQE